MRVTQADREAATDLLDEISALLSHDGIGQVADLIRDGEYDEHEATLAFAAHRIAALEEAAKVAEGLKREVPYEHNQYPCTTTMGRIATAIRALKGDTDV